MGGACSTHEEMRNVYNILVAISDGKRQLGRPERRWEDNIRTGLREIGWEDVDWMHLANVRTNGRFLCTR
jgi:hypothetical protein